MSVADLQRGCLPIGAEILRKNDPDQNNILVPLLKSLDHEVSISANPRGPCIT